MSSFIPRWVLPTLLLVTISGAAAKPLNILFAISDDQSWPHASAYANTGVKTPTFDKLAREGALFDNAFAPAPQCSPCRAAILTGQNIWQLEEAGTHGSVFPKKFPAFTRKLEENGYHVGFTGKPWAPGNWKDGGWQKNPVGDEFNAHRLDPPNPAISDIDYTENFRTFLKQRDSGQPFFFWYGAHEPHRVYEYGSGSENGISPDKLALPPFLPDSETTRHDLADYFLEIEWFDRHLGRMLAILEEHGELQNTLIIVTADNGMPFPYAKANLFEFGTHVPLVITLSERIEPQKNESLVSLIDIGPTILDFAELPELDNISGKSLRPTLQSGDLHREYVLTGRERHTHARPDNLGYPARAIRTEKFLYIWNIKPDRWPAGDPSPDGLTQAQLTGTISPDFKSVEEGYEDVDSAPSKTYMMDAPSLFPDLFANAFGKRREEQLFKIQNDPHCLNDLSENPEYAETLATLRNQLKAQLTKEADPRLLGSGDIFESYPRFDKMRFFPGFKKRGAYNPTYAQ